VTREHFEDLVRKAIDGIPQRFRKHMKNVVVLVEDEPSSELLRQLGVPSGDTLFGLYHGIPLTERPWNFGGALPDRITIYQGPIEQESEDEEGVVTTIGETVIHEVGHYFGLSEEELEAIEERYWLRRQRKPEEEGQQ
jgi:predicted Zn-dependent protease with MMP-like domain